MFIVCFDNHSPLKEYRGIGLHVVSAYYGVYCPGIARHIERLESVMNRLARVPVLIGLDKNVHSPLWYCECRQYVGWGLGTEYRRNNMEGFILSRNLRIHNQPDQRATFCSPTGSSNVGLILSTRGIAVFEWRCMKVSATIS